MPDLRGGRRGQEVRLTDPEEQAERAFALRVAERVARHAWVKPSAVQRVAKRLASRGPHYVIRLARWWGVRIPGERAA